MNRMFPTICETNVQLYFSCLTVLGGLVSFKCVVQFILKPSMPPHRFLCVIFAAYTHCNAIKS